MITGVIRGKAKKKNQLWEDRDSREDNLGFSIVLTKLCDTCVKEYVWIWHYEIFFILKSNAKEF